jgi:hypothetical protein
MVKAFLRFLRENTRWWLVPTLVMLLVLAALLLLSSGSTVAPFLYRQ